MFPVDINTHQALIAARQRELEVEAANYRLVQSLAGDVPPLRQRIGSLLITLGQKLAQEPKNDARLVLSARHQ